ncbi:MAG TPA: hypothetical protein VF975_08250, partial [Thermoanaerobaculia bacterium]
RALESTHDPESALAGEIVHHALLGGEPQLAVTAAIAAGHRCLRLFAYTEALNVARQGLQIAETLPENLGISTQVELLHVIAMSRTSVKERFAWQPRVEKLLSEARARGLNREASLAAHVMAILYADNENFGPAADMTIQSAEMIRKDDPITAVGRIANTGRCLIFIQRDVERGRILIDEAQALAVQARIEHTEIPLGLGYYYAHVGDDARAIPELERAHASAAREQDHWREWISMMRLATLALERHDAANALRYCERLAPIATKMTGGSEGPVSEALTALARIISGEAVEIEEKLDLLREIDSKGDLAYALVYLAELDRDAGEVDRARQRAEEALQAAEMVDRRTEAALARSLLAEIASNAALLQPALAAAQWDDLTKRAQDRVTAAAARLNIRSSQKKEKKDGAHRSRTNV